MANQKLVKGYMTKTRRDEATGRGFVKHVAVFEDNTIKQTVNEHPVNGDSFNGKNWLWEAIPEMPADCEYIGMYPANM